MRIDVGRLRAEHDRFLSAHSAMVDDSLRGAAEIVETENWLRPGFKPQTGALQAATKVRVVRTRSGKVVRVTNAKKYARPIEEGANPHWIFPYRARMLRFRGRDGNVVFRKFVRHPGNKAFWFLRKASDVGYDRLGRILTNGMQRIARIRF